MYITNDEVLDRSKSDEVILIRSRLCRVGHVACMPDEWPVKAIPYGELAEGSRRVGCPLLLYKDTMKDILKHEVALNTWREIVGDRSAWQRFTSDICDKIETGGKATWKKGRSITRGAENDHELLTLIDLLCVIRVRF